MIKKIYSYNVNGIRAAFKKDFLVWVQESSPDILCIQEIKAMEEQVETDLIAQAGYNHYWFPAQKKGYSGVAIFSKEEPDHLEYGMGIPKYDNEGRVLRADYGDVSVLSCYFPSGTTGGVRQDFKMDFLHDFHKYIDELRREREKLIIVGDYNICHREIDINHPERHHKTSGFLPEEREWMTNFLESGFIDTFRIYRSEPERYSWWSYRAGARAKNLGWRIDYQLVTENLREKLVNADIYSDVVHSDHCPVSLEIEFE